MNLTGCLFPSVTEEGAAVRENTTRGIKIHRLHVQNKGLMAVYKDGRCDSSPEVKQNDLVVGFSTDGFCHFKVVPLMLIYV